MSDLPNKTTVVVGAGPTGLAAACKLLEGGKQHVLILEKSSRIGGLAATIEKNGWRFDLGSHRIHPECEPEIMNFISDLCGHKIDKSLRQGLLYLEGVPLSYPPAALDILSSFGWLRTSTFTLQLAFARLRQIFNPIDTGNFEGYLRARFGDGLYELLYEPYAKKLWALNPSEIAREPAEKRARSLAPSKFFKNLLKRQNYFYYPSEGFGQISVALGERIRSLGGCLETSAEIISIVAGSNSSIDSLTFKNSAGQRTTVQVESMVFTPATAILDQLLECQHPTQPPVAEALSWRGLRVLFMVGNCFLPTEHEAFYLPDPRFLCGRISEPAKYSISTSSDSSIRGLAVEVPCSVGDDIWQMPEELLAKKCAAELQQLGIMKADQDNMPDVFSVKLDRVYPVYKLGWEQVMRRQLEYYNSFNNLFVVGRAPLFLHCNLDHALSMGMKTADTILNHRNNRSYWPELQSGFRGYMVRE